MAQNQSYGKFETPEGTTIARIRKGGNNFEILVDMNNALKFRKGEMSSFQAETDRIFNDIKKGDVASNAELDVAFGTTDAQKIAEEIVKHGEVLVTQEKRNEEQEKKFKQIVDFLTRNAIDPQSGRPHSGERIKSSLEEAGVNIKNVPVENQIGDIVDKLSAILPIKIEKKKIKLTIPAIHTGKVYGQIATYKKDEKWLDNGSLEAMVEVPAGLIMDFYDKINSMTQGSVLTEEIKDE